ncbi:MULTISPECIES: hypothetical protein [unclassified Gilliamella]|uniref:hypothetical protein n=1 Tax=unclassified Gilliamella TaxID=2685620 RepID=UPI00226AFBB6|nr:MULTISPECIES: hypothetical protein [unclassified Gilliamella]MCX8583436.1 hypothetical protein [Gilliamella sp. B3372]MCX8594048.1 hypothetical protein [Gilliamella sp. B3367]
MSNIANWSYTAKATIWRVAGENEYGKKIFHPPELIYCDYGLDSAARLGDIGKGFVIKNTFWTEYALASEGDFILIGESSELDPVKTGADEIKHIIRYADTFERIADDYALVTGE